MLDLDTGSLGGGRLGFCVFWLLVAAALALTLVGITFPGRFVNTVVTGVEVGFGATGEAPFLGGRKNARDAAAFSMLIGGTLGADATAGFLADTFLVMGRAAVALEAAFTNVGFADAAGVLFVFRAPPCHRVALILQVSPLALRTTVALTRRSNT
jgi:hypothetical protein